MSMVKGMPTGQNAVEYNEATMLIKEYAREICTSNLSHEKLLLKISRMHELSHTLEKIWDRQS